MLVRVKVGVMARLGLTLSLKITLTIPNLNLTCNFEVQSVMSDVIVTSEKYGKKNLPQKHVFDKQSCQINPEQKNLFTSNFDKIIN